MKKLFKIDDFGAGCFALILIGLIVPIMTIWYFA